MEQEKIVEEIMEAQADLQTALGVFRLEQRRIVGDLSLIEDRLERSLARLHRLLDTLGKPMFGPAQHEDINPNPCEHVWTDIRNLVIESGEWCHKCGTIREGEV